MWGQQPVRITTFCVSHKLSGEMLPAGAFSQI
jgi:hypothetical protein